MLAPLVSLLDGRRLVVLTGAGCSTESGIPDYRGPETRRRALNPVQAREFASRPEARIRYWARAVLGWSRIAGASPNPAHSALAQLERAGIARGVITQNVDGLHQAAGSQRVIELHGALSRVRCLGCGDLEARTSVQERLMAANPGWADQSVEVLPDGDTEVLDTRLARFCLVGCLKCGGDLKPDVVFFGEGVPREVVEGAFALLDEGEALLVVGSSLAVFSGYRFVRRARERGIPIGIVNLGESRGDPDAQVRVDARAGEVLPALVRALRRDS